MGILDDLLSSAMRGQNGQSERGGLGRQAPAPASGGGGMSEIMISLMPALLSMLASRSGGAAQPGRASGVGGGGLGDLLGQVLGGGARGGSGQGGLGGLGALLEQLQQKGYGDQARSWVGSGQNLPIAPDAMEQIFGRGALSQLAGHAGVSEADTSRGLSELLPELVNRVTPNGDVPDHDSLAASVQDLGRRFGLV